MDFTSIFTSQGDPGNRAWTARAALLFTLAIYLAVSATGRAEDELRPSAVPTDTIMPDDLSESTVEERFTVLEDKLTQLSEDHDKLKKEYTALQDELKTAAYSGHSNATMQVNGRIHLDYWSFPGDSPAVNIWENNNEDISPQDRFGFRRLRFGVKGDLWKTMEYKIEMEFAGGNDTEFRDAYFGWKDVPFLHTLLMGNQKRPYGLDHINSSRFNVFMERPFVIEGFNQDARRLGICSYGYTEDLRWNWRAGVFNLQNVQAEGNYTSDHYQGELAGRLASTFWYDETSGGRGYGHFALSGTVADPDGTGSAGNATNQAQFRTRPEARSVNRWLDTGMIAGADNYQLLGVENVWNFGALQCTAEYQNVWLDRNGGTDLHFDGGYFYVAYFLTGEFMPWNREAGQLDRIQPLENFFLVDTCNDGIRGGWGAWQIAYRVSYANFSDQDIFGGRGLSHTLGFNWYWNAWSRMQFNTAYGDIYNHDGEVDDDNDPATPLVPTGPISGHYAYIGARFMVDF